MRTLLIKDVLTDEGLFSVHKNGGTYYFETPLDKLDKEVLVVGRISGHVKG